MERRIKLQQSRLISIATFVIAPYTVSKHCGIIVKELSISGKLSKRKESGDFKSRGWIGVSGRKSEKGKWRQVTTGPV